MGKFLCIVTVVVGLVVLGGGAGLPEAAAKGAKAAKSAKAAAPAKAVNACGCYADSQGRCFCGKGGKGKCACPGECEPKGCEEKRAKQMEKEIAAETKKAAEADKRQRAKGKAGTAGATGGKTKGKD